MIRFPGVLQPPSEARGDAGLCQADRLVVKKGLRAWMARGTEHREAVLAAAMCGCLQCYGDEWPAAGRYNAQPGTVRFTNRLVLSASGSQMRCSGPVGLSSFLEEEEERDTRGGAIRFREIYRECGGELSFAATQTRTDDRSDREACSDEKARKVRVRD
jgi:hypothetical protein